MSSIGVSDNAFKGYKTITSVSFNSDCSYVGENAFNGCESLVEINRDNEITEIKSGAFAKTGIGSAVFNDLTTLHDDAFADCSNLSYVNIPHCSDIQSGAFKNCEKLSDIKLENCTTIGESAFYDCSSIEEVTLNKCSYIGESAFMNCTNLKQVYITTASCTLSPNVFYISDDQGVRINDSVCFYFSADVFEKYKDDSSISNNPWYNYRDNMAKINVNNQIIYRTTDNVAITIKNSEDIIKEVGYGNKYGWINFYDELKYLNDKIFKGSTTLESLELPSSCEKIDEYAFQDCKSLNRFKIPDTIKSIGEGAFAGCESLEKFDGESALLLDDKKIICNNTLICVLPSDNTRIYNISEIDKDITRLGAKCFYGNNNIRRVNIPDSVTSIGDNAFGGCENLCEVHFYGDTLPNIGEALFPKNENLKIFVPESLYDELVSDSNSNYQYYLDYIYPMPNDKKIIYYVDENNKYETIQNTSKILEENWVNAEKSSNITRVIVGEGVAEIGAFAFRNFSNLTDIYLSDNITALKEGCFYNCSNLTRMHIPYGGSDNNSNGLTCGIDVFYGCKNLEKFDSYYDGYVSGDGRCYIDDKSRLVFFAQGGLKEYLEEGEYYLEEGKYKYELPDVISIGTSVFKNVFNKQLIKITISDKTTSIGDGAFNGCKSIGEINLPNNLTRIGDSAFDGCVKLNIVDESIPKNIKKIGNATFKGCESIAELKLPENLETIGADAFKGCSNLKISQIPNMVKTIESGAFKGCTSLGVISLSNNLKAINSDVFYGCTNLITDLPDNLTRIEKNAFKGCSNLNISQIPNAVTYIGEGAFEGCTSLTELYLNNKIKNINNRTFYGCTSLSKVEISDAIEKIGNSAFCGCVKLEELDLSKSNIKTIGQSAFENCEMYMRDKPFGFTDNLTSLGVACFKNTGVSEIYYILDESKIVENTYKIPDSIFEGCKQLTKVNISISQSNTKKYIEIGKMAFQNCTSLVKLDMTNVSIINDDAFNNCNLSKLYLPLTLELLGNNCFINTIIKKGNYTTKTKLNIYIPNSLTTPPKFIKNDDKPFGEANTSHLYIDISDIMYDTYARNGYWKQYKSCMKQPSSDKPVIRPL